MTESFGAKLRQARVAQGLSQGKLGGSRYSASYVSHLETGRRSPTRQVAEYFARRLGIEVSELTGGEFRDVEASESVAAITVLGLEALTAAMHGAATDTLVAATELAGAAANAERPDLWWSASFMRGRVLEIREQYDDSIAEADLLLQHPLSVSSPSLRTEARTLAAEASRGGGKLALALVHASEALVASRPLPPGRRQAIDALVVHMSVLAELGRMDEAQEDAARLLARRDTAARDRTQGRLAWALGNIAFMVGDTERGMEEHQRAAAILSPEPDLRMWARFVKATASKRISAGRLEDTDRLLTSAEHALALIGQPGDKAELEIIKAEREILLGNPGEAARLMDSLLATARKLEPQTTPAPTMTAAENLLAPPKAVPDPVDLPPQTLADAHETAGVANLRLGQPVRARGHLAKAAELYEETGAIARALQCWKQHAAATIEGSTAVS